jgi:hypothetical protein
MIRRTFTTALLLLSITIGCSSQQATGLLVDVEIIDINRADLERYWVRKQGNIYLVLSGRQIQALEDGEEGYVIAQVVINSMGKVAEFDVLESEPVGLYESAAERAIRKSCCYLAKANINRAPVRVVLAFPFPDTRRAGTKAYIRMVIERADEYEPY